MIIGHLAAQLASARGTTDLKDLEEVASILGVPSGEVLMEMMQAAYVKQGEDLDAYTESSGKIYDDLTEISNIVSSQVLDYYLRQYKNRPNVALYLGKAHEGIATLDLSTIPKRLRFDDEKIRTMIEDKRLALSRRILRVFGIDLPIRKETVLSDMGLTRKEPSEFKEESKEITRVSKILGEIPDITENLKTAILHWEKNLFGLRRVRRSGYEKYLSSDNSLYQIWGAAAHLADIVDVARKENRDLTPQEIETVRADFIKAAQTRSKLSEYFQNEGEEILELANGIQVLEQVIKKLQ